MKRSMMIPLITLLLSGTAYAAPLDEPMVTRSAPDAVTVNWDKSNPVDVLLSANPAAAIDEAKLVSKDDRDGTETVKVGAGERVYFLLKDRKSGEIVRVAERAVPLEQGSNFRDLGGYRAADSKHVKWGLIYRSGGQPMLTDTDVKNIQSLKIAHLVDLRSNEERVLAPGRIDGVPYQAVGYSMMSLMGNGPAKNGEGVYRKMPALLTPQLRLVFEDLLAKKGPVAYNCSAGQDRTGFVSAIVLSALGVPRETIVKDYHLSTTLRRPEWEMPKIDTAVHANNPIALYFAKNLQDPAVSKPKPLQDPDGTAFLTYAFDEIDKQWGSVDAFLEKEIGVTKTDIAALRVDYLQ